MIIGAFDDSTFLFPGYVKNNMTYIDIICENTVDTRIVKALRKKVDIATQIMGEELKEWI